ncbi:uncharacterized protein LOC111710405 [Eurytemora carolleeae]|uniref:uncharacterized protein LOC111710405 n=1 Tax=Eurytemora carolleeae TaxID=1294199 RepID=UPI000C7790BF|nr:uncharacterized protein LOC111710405 [Eurytemora carolleeae]|eukprot:XP_023340253.1 uncharacterized protein LOC111710405 [Eurytemora affinis]
MGLKPTGLTVEKMMFYRAERQFTLGVICLFGLYMGWINFRHYEHNNRPVVQLQGMEKKDSSVEQSNLRPSLGGRYEDILQLCGELCDLSKPIKRTAGDLLGMGTVTAKVDCEAVFSSAEIDRPSGHPPMAWETIPHNLQNEFSHNGQVDIVSSFFDETSQVVQQEANDVRIYTKSFVQSYVDGFVAGTPNDTYPGASEMINQALSKIEVKEKTVLIIGTMTPWVEAVIISKQPSQVMTLEYATSKSEYPGLEFVTPLVFRQMYKEGKLPVFDIIVTYSSVEHSGLGRYGDAINPWGDILTIARASCVTSPDAKLIIGVPTTGKDRIEFNAHRVYGPILYPYLVTNWKLVWSSSGTRTPAPHEPWHYQPVYMFEKNL